MKNQILFSLVLVAIHAESQSRIIPHLTQAGGGFSTTILIENRGSSSATLQLQPYTASGQALENTDVTIPGGTTLSEQAVVLLPDGSAYFHIEASNDIQVMVAYQVASGQGSPAHLGETREQSTSWRIFPGNWDIVFDGVAVVNLGTESTDVQIEHHLMDGSLIQSLTALSDLGPNQKQLYVIGSPSGSSFDSGIEGYFDLKATQPIVMASLRGTPPNAPIGYLWENPPIRLEGQIQPVDAEPTQWKSHGVGGGGALFSPSISPHNSSEVYLACDMSELFHTTTMGKSWETVPFSTIQANLPTKIQFTSDPLVLYAIDTRSDALTPVKSLDAGQHFSALGQDPTQGETYAMFADPTGSNRLIISSYDNIFISLDGGSSFTSVYHDTTGLGAYIAGAYFDTDLILLGLNAGLLASQDGGSSFSLLPLPGISSGDGFVSFAASKGSGGTRLIGITMGQGDIYPGMNGSDAFSYTGIFSMIWGDAAWESSSQGIAQGDYPGFVAMARDHAEIAYVAGASDNSVPIVYKTENSGATWVSIFETAQNANIATGWSGDQGDEPWWYPEYVLGLAVSPNNPDIAVITDLGFAHATVDGGISWKQMYVTPDTQNNAGYVTPVRHYYQGVGLEDTSVWWLNWSDANTIFAAFTDIGGIRSEDAGQTWGFDYSGHNLNSMYHVISQPSGTLLAATSSIHDLYQSPWLEDSRIDGGTGLVLSSGDKGKTWNSLKDFGHPVIWLAVDPNQSNTVYASVIHSSDGGIYRSENINSGVSATWQWMSKPPRTEGHPFNVYVLNDGLLICTYSGRRQNGAFTASSGVFISSDRGATWVDVSDPGMLYWTKDLTIDPHDPSQNTWYVSVWSGWGGPSSGLGGIYRTRDRGNTWNRVREFERASSLAIDPNQRNKMYVTTETEGLWFSSNGNNDVPQFDWVESYPFRQPERVFFNPFNPNEIWVCSFGNGIRVGTRGN